MSCLCLSTPSSAPSAMACACAHQRPPSHGVEGDQGALGDLPSKGSALKSNADMDVSDGGAEDAEALQKGEDNAQLHKEATPLAKGNRVVSF